MKKHTWFPPLLAALLLLPVASLADHGGDHTMVVTVERVETERLIIHGEDGERVLVMTTATVRPPRLEPGDHVVVKMEGDSLAEIMVIDDSIDITGDLPNDRNLALLGSVKATSPDHLIVKTVTGESAFVIDPEKLFPPVPTADDNVVVLYRVVDLAGKDKLMAEELIWLPEDVDLTAESSVKVSYEPIEGETRTARVETTRTTDRTMDHADHAGVADHEARADHAHAEANAELDRRVNLDRDRNDTETSTRTRLPQTASAMPLIGLLGLLSLLGAVSIRIFRA